MARKLGIWLGGCLLVTVLGMVPPANVRMNSVNFKNILRWEPPAFPKGNVTYTAQFQSYNSFQDKCRSTALTECDFSSLSKYGEHTVRVRAESADERSDWVNITFCPVDDTLIGPPEVQAEVLADSLQLRFLAPRVVGEPETWTMKNFYTSWVYNVQYWQNGTDEKFQMTAPYDFEVLRNLEPWTTYCVQVQGFLPNQNKTGEWSQPVCEQTTSDEMTPPWVVAVVLMASVFAVLLLLLGCAALTWYIYKKTKYTFAPGHCLPPHLKEFLSHPHHSALLLFSLPPPGDDEVFDKLSVIMESDKLSVVMEGDRLSVIMKDAESRLQSPADSRSLRVSSQPVPEQETRATGHGDPPPLTSASERDQSTRQGPRLPEHTPALEVWDTGLV